MVELAPAAVIAVACAVAVVSIFACGYLVAQMRSERATPVEAWSVPRHAAGVGRVLTIHPGTERGISPVVDFRVPVRAAA